MDTKIIIKRVGIIFILVISLICFVCGISSARAATTMNMLDNKSKRIDIRFLVDSSYTMKKNDPNKLRIRALQKIIKNLPDTATSGVWTYGKYVNMLIPLGVTNPAWKKRAIYELDKIDGYGNNRDLYSAIENAAHGWQQSKDERKKYMLILTNGGLDLENMAAQQAQHRKMLLTRTLAKLKKSGIAIHILSFNKNSDNRLLKILAKETGGNWYAVYNIKLLPEVIEHVYSLLNNNKGKTMSAAIKAPAEKIAAEVFKEEADEQDSANMATPVIQSSRSKGNSSAASLEKTTVKKIRRVVSEGSLASNIELANEVNDKEWQLITAGQ